MKQVLNQLIQLQELSFSLAEQLAAANPPARLKPLEDSISKLIEKLPEDIARRYQRLQKQGPLVVVPTTRGNCSGCGMAVPTGVANEIRLAKEIFTCTNCGRFLYFQDNLPRQPQKPGAGKRPLTAGIARFSDSLLMAPRLEAKTGEEAIGELARLLAGHGYVENPDALVDLALRREAMVSTVVEHGLAFPHVRNVEGGSLTFALGLKPAGLKVTPGDSQLARMIFFIVIPTAASAFYLRLLAGLVRTFGEADARAKMLKCDTPDAMWKLLTSLTRQTIQ